MTRINLIGLFAFALLGTAWCVVAAEEEGDVIEIIETAVKFGDCPVSVQKTIQQESVRAKLNEVIKLTEADKVNYRAGVTFEMRDYEILVDEDGTLLGKMLIDDDETTLELELSECPAAVQKTLKREARGSEIETVYKVTNVEKTEYVIGAKIEGKDYEIIVTEDGILISKLLDEDSDDEKKPEEEVKET